jgi:hypothetical protein
MMRSMQAVARGFAAAAPAGARGLATKSHFPFIDKVPFEGPTSLNPLAFKHYKADEKIMGRVRTHS